MAVAARPGPRCQLTLHLSLWRAGQLPLISRVHQRPRPPQNCTGRFSLLLEPWGCPPAARGCSVIAEPAAPTLWGRASGRTAPKPPTTTNPASLAPQPTDTSELRAAESTRLSEVSASPWSRLTRCGRQTAETPHSRARVRCKPSLFALRTS